jgi:hypothetical protein
MGEEMKKLLLAAVALAALSAPAYAGSNMCQGYIYVEGTTGYVADPLGDWSEPASDDAQCSFSTTSKVGKMILAKCPVGWGCSIDLPLEAKRTPIITTRMSIQKECNGRCGYRVYDQNHNLVKSNEAGPAPKWTSKDRDWHPTRMPARY